MIDVGDGFADRAFIQCGLLVNQSGHERGVAELVDAARQALGVLEDAGHGIVGEERAGGVASDLDVVTDVADSFLKVQRAEVIAHCEPLIERLVDREAHGAAQIGMADQDQGRQGVAVHAVAEEETHLLQHRLGQQMRLVDNHEWGAALVGAQIGQGGADGGHHTRLGERRLVAEGQQQVAVDADNPSGGIGQVDHQVAVGVQAGGKGAHRGGLAGADFAGDQAEAAFTEQVGQASGQFFLACGGEQLVGFDGLGEGRAGEAVVFLKHRVSPL